MTFASQELCNRFGEGPRGKLPDDIWRDSKVCAGKVLQAGRLTFKLGKLGRRRDGRRCCDASPKALVDTLEHLGSPSSRIARNSVYLFIELA